MPEDGAQLGSANGRQVEAIESHRVNKHTSEDSIQVDFSLEAAQFNPEWHRCLLITITHLLILLLIVTSHHLKHK